MYPKLSVEDRKILEALHQEGIPSKMLAEMEGITEQTMSYRHDRAIGRLLRLLGGSKPQPAHDGECNHWVGTRTVMSNSQAMAVQSSYYDE